MLMSPSVTIEHCGYGDTKNIMISSLSPLSPLSPLSSREYWKIDRARVLGKVPDDDGDNGDKLEFTVDNMASVPMVTLMVTSPSTLVTQPDPSHSAGEA